MENPTTRVCVSVLRENHVKRVDLCRPVLLLVLLFSAIFIFPALGFDDETHKKITERALTPISFSPGALETINQASKAQNETSGANLPNLLEAGRHFNDNALGAGYDFFRSKAEEALDLAHDCYKNEGNLQGARYRFGEGIHALQDFYSRSNWIEKEFAEGSNPIAFRWDLFSPWSWDSGYSRWKRTWTGSLPEGLRTGYMSRAEWRVGPMVTQRRSSASEDVGTRAQIIKEFQDQDYQNTQNPRLRRTFPYNSDYKERVKQQANFPRVIEYATQDPTKALLHFDINKDTPNTMEGSVLTPAGNTLYDVAADLAATDTQRHWRAHMERLAFEKYGGCAGLIIPAFKGTPIPEIKMRVTIDRNQQARNMPIRGSIAVRVTNLPKPMKKPIRVEVKMYLEPSNDPDSRGGNAKLKVLEFSQEREESFSLEPFNLMIGDRSGKYDLVAIASYECDPDFKPNKQRIALDENDLEIKSATCDPNPLCLGETADLTVRYDYDETSGGKVYGEGTIENADKSQIHLINKRELPLTRSGEAMELAPFKETWKPTAAGKYLWRIKLSTNQNEPPKTSEVVINVNTPGEKGVAGNGRLNEIEGKIGDNFTLTVNYVVSGAKRNVSFTPVEASQVQQVDGNLEDVAPRAPPPQLTSKCEPIKRQTTFVYTATKAGIFDWRYQIEVPGYGKLTDSIRFTVNVDKNLVIDSETVEPAEAATGSTFRLKVKYHIRGMSASTYQTVTERSDISRTATASFRPSPRPVNSSDPTVLTEHGPYTATKPGDYLWTYDIDAGPFGRERRAVAFRVLDTTQRSIDLLSATVTPVRGGVGTTHTLTVRYKLVGLKPKEKVEVHENDYVEFSKQEAHATVTHIVEEPKVFGMKVAGFVSKYSGKHRWNFIIDADGFRTLYGGVSFDVFEDEVKPQLNARLEFPMITLAPGETKNCTTYISGYKGDTQDRVEIVYPQISDNWGSLPGQIQVFPGNTSMDPWSMRGAGDYTKEYAAGQGYRARETAPPGVTPVTIIVRQKGAGQVALTLFVKVVRKGESTMGTEQDTPRLPGTYTQRTRPPGGPQIPDTAEPDIPTTVQTGPDEANAPGGPNGENNGEPSGPGSSTSPAVTPTPSSSTTQPGTNTSTTSPGSSSSPGSSTSASATGPNEVVYVLKEVLIGTAPDGLAVTTKRSTKPTGVATVTKEYSPNTSDPLATSKPPTYGHIALKGTLAWELPKEVVLRNNPNQPSSPFGAKFETKIRVAVNVKTERCEGVRRTYGIFTDNKTWVQKDIVGNGEISESIERTHTATLSEFATNGNHEPSITVQFNPSMAIFQFQHWMLAAPSIGMASAKYVLKTSESTSEPEETTDESDGEGDQKKQIEAWLEHDEITVEAGFLPSTRSAIYIKGWDRTTSKPIQVLYPGLGFMNSLPDGLHVFSGAGSQGPDVLSRGSSDVGVYTWTESYDAIRGAKPGIYQVPIIVKQEGAGSVQLVQTIKIVPSRSPSGTLTMLQNRTNQATPTTPTATPSPWGQPITNANPPPMTHTPTTTVIPQAPPKADWRNMPGFWAGGNGSVVAIGRQGNCLSGWFVQPGSNMDQFAGDWCFVNACPTSPCSDTVVTETGFCYQYKDANRAARVYPGARMVIKISPDGKQLTYTYNCRGMDDDGEKTAVDTRTNWTGPVARPSAVPTTPLPPTRPTPAPEPTPQPTCSPQPASTPAAVAAPSTTPDHHTQQTPGTTSGEPAHTPPPANKPSGFAGTWYVETFGAITFTEAGGRCRGIFQPGANAKGYWDGYAADGVFNGIYNMDYFGEKWSGRLTVRFREDKSYLFRADWVSSTGKTGYWNGSKAD